MLTSISCRVIEKAERFRCRKAELRLLRLRIVVRSVESILWWLGGNIIMSIHQSVIRGSWHGRATKPNPGCLATPGEIRVLLPQHPIAAELELPGFANDEFLRGHPPR
jgi:hypothetical protein